MSAAGSGAGQQVLSGYGKPDSAASDLGTIKPGEAKGPNLRYADEWALANTILTFRDAAGVHWIRMPDGTLKEDRGTSRDTLSEVYRG